MQDPRNLSWNQFNQARRFPLLFGCNPVSRDGHFMIPDDLLVGLYLSYGLGHGLDDPGGFYLGSLLYWRTGLSLAIYYRRPGDEAGATIAETTIDLTSERRTASLLGLNRRFFYGHVVFGTFSGLEKQPAGQWLFQPDAAPIDPFCIRPTVSEISALYVQNAGKTLGPFYGDITLAAGERITLSVRSADGLLQCLEDTPSETGTEVVIHADADGGNGGTSGSPVETINGVEPDENGNVTILGRSCTSITTQADQATILFDDTCAEPCCTCKEREPTLAKIRELEQSIASLRSHLDTLSLQADFLAQSAASIG